MNKWLDCIKGDTPAGGFGNDESQGSPRKSPTTDSLPEKPSHREAPLPPPPAPTPAAAPVAPPAAAPVPAPTTAPAPAPPAKDGKEKKEKKKRSLFGKKR